MNSSHPGTSSLFQCKFRQLRGRQSSFPEYARVCLVLFLFFLEIFIYLGVLAHTYVQVGGEAEEDRDSQEDSAPRVEPTWAQSSDPET